MNTLAERVKFARERAGLTQQEVADLAGMKQPSYFKIETGKTKRTGFINKLANVLKVDSNWLETGNGSIDTHSKNFDLQAHIDSLPSAITHEQAVAEGQESIMVDVYDLSYCCGDGDKVEYEPLKKRLPFDPSFFTRRNIRPENFKLIFAKGDSMARYINEGDAIGVDISQTEIKDGEAYALFLDGDNMIKRLFIEGGGRLRLSSDNPAYKDKIIEPEFADSLKIVGRVVYRSG